MTKKDIINVIAQQRWVESIITNIAGNADDTLNDLSQNIYVDLLMKDEDKIVKLYETNQLKFFIVRMVTNNVFSKNSPYYQTFKRFRDREVNIDDFTNKL